ncbi:Do family serine endopeptidase [Parasulfuritortus cantonensis]|nr:Do family serine endopeptidase [Parasulfuritortus cantonensis]
MVSHLRVLALLLLVQVAPAMAADPASFHQARAGTPPNMALPDFSALVVRQGPAVVNVRIFRNKADEPDQAGEAARKPLHMPPRETGLGSGFVVTPDGVILTNRHVVADADKIMVRFADKHELPARVLGVDPLTDVAVLKVEAAKLPTVNLGDSSQLQVGQWVLAIGAPLGLERTATQGIISALGRALPNDSYVPFIQTDVPINPGNSGGPLFDLAGRVIGINSQIVSNSGGYMGLSFAIPINTALAVAKQIMADGHATHGWLGVSAQDLTIELAQAYGLDSPRGALVNEVRPAGPAEQAGLEPGDVILALDDTAITDSADLPPLIGASQPGTDHVLSVLRNGTTVRLKTKVGELGQDNLARKHSLTRIDRLGLEVSDLDLAIKQVMAIHGGVAVEETAPGPAVEAGIEAGDILLKVGRNEVENAASLAGLVKQLPTGQPIPVLIKRQESTTFLTIVIPKHD